MKKILGFGSVIIVLALMAGFNSGCSSDSDPGTNSTVMLSGYWDGYTSLHGAFSMQLTQNGDAITGSIIISNASTSVSGNISGDTVTLTGSVGTNTFQTEDEDTTISTNTVATTIYTLTGTANTNRDYMAGNYATAVLFGPLASGSWSAHKQTE